MLLLGINGHAQVTTYFYGRNKIESKDETAALYSVAIHDNQTWVTVELIPTKNRSFMHFWTSDNTYIIVSKNIELPIIGFLHNNKIDKEPFSGDWGWDNVEKGKKYYYTMIFAGKIPPGVTNFTLTDKGTKYGSHGYGFSNYTINNPPTYVNQWSEFSVKQNIDSNNDGICGIYEGSNNTGYKLGCIKENGEYKLIYLGSLKPKCWWQVGDIKAVLRPSATNGLFKADWYMQNTMLESNCYVLFDGSSMKTSFGTEEVFYLKMYPTFNSERLSTIEDRWSGTGFALDNGYIATNYHVVENAKSIKVQGIKGDLSVEYNATVISTDKFNDLAIIKINDSRFNGFGSIPYRIKTSTSDVGENVFVLGYPLTTSMGDEIKLTTGVISSKSGFQGDVSLYQISAPIQPGNSGGPLFDGQGNLIGIVNAKHRGAENVSYAIKASYLNNLAESALSISLLPTNNVISGMSLSNKVKSLKNFVFIITCSSSNTAESTYSTSLTSSSKSINYPSVRISLAPRAKIKKVVLDRNYTAVEITINNLFYHENKKHYTQYYNIDKNAYIIANGIRYTMTKAEGIKIAPDLTYFSYEGQDVSFTLYFPAIPTSATSIDLIESSQSDWQFFDIQLR